MCGLSIFTGLVDILRDQMMADAQIKINQASPKFHGPNGFPLLSTNPRNLKNCFITLKKVVRLFKPECS